MALPAALGELSLNTIGEAIAFAAGIAIGPALDPVATALVQEAWKVAPIKAVDPTTAAEITAEDVEQLEWATAEARQHGISSERFAAILGAVLNAPGTGELFALWRRDEISDDDFEHGLRKAKLEPRWDAPLRALKEARLDPAVIAAAIVRGLVHDPGILPVGPPSAVGKVSAFPVFNLDAIAEAAASGIDRDRLSVMVGNYGRPMAPEGAASSTFRGIIERVDFDRAISEGDVRNEWADAIFEHQRQIPTVHEFIEYRLRGWGDDEVMYAGTATHGMTREHTDVLFKISGRPPSAHQVFIGLRRGGVYDGPTTEIPPPILKAMQESNIRPEWYHIIWKGLEVYPTSFVLRALTESGDITEAESNTILDYEGWNEPLAETVAKKWSATPSTTGSSLASKAKTSALAALHKSYVNDRTDAAKATALMTKLEVPATEQAAALDIWNEERAIVRSELTPTQIKKAIGQPGKDAAWALERLRELGYSDVDAATLLGE